MSAHTEPSRITQRLLAALDVARERLGALSVHASRVAAFQVLSGALSGSYRRPSLSGMLWSSRVKAGSAPV